MTALTGLLRYGQLRLLQRGWLGGWLAAAPSATLNRRLRGYPCNHNYALAGQEIIASPQLLERSSAISSLYPTRLGRFLDIGSCKGYFVFQARHHHGCPLAVGIDIHKPFIDVARDVARQVQIDSVHFHLATLESVAQDVEQFGGPFDTVQLVSTYHYLYWGSALDSKCYGDHDAILAMLARICTGQVVFASPLEVKNCPASVQMQAGKRRSHDYTAAGFLRAADRWFDVVDEGFMDRKRKRNLLRMRRRPGG